MTRPSWSLVVYNIAFKGYFFKRDGLFKALKHKRKLHKAALDF